MRNLVILAALFASVPSARADAPYYRFWRGWKLPALSDARFLEGLNDVFVGATVEVGKCRGLVSYQPALPPSPADRGEEGAYLPDEIALVAYRSEGAYRAIRATPEGERYSNLHWDYFDRDKSRSLVPGPFTGTAALDRAYDLRQSGADWQRGFSVLRIWTRKPGVDDERYLEHASQYLVRLQRGYPRDLLLSTLALLTDRYLIEYLLWPNEDVYRGMKDTLEEVVERGMRELFLVQALERPARRALRLEYTDALNVPFATSSCPQ